MGNATLGQEGRRAGGQEGSQRSWGFSAKKQKGGVVPLVLRPRDPREGVQGGRAGIDHLSGTRRHLQFPENPEDRTEAEQHSFSHSATVCVHCSATFPQPLSLFMPFGEKGLEESSTWRRFQTGEMKRSRRRYRRVSSPLGPGCSKSHGKSTGSPRRWDTNRPSFQS